MVTFGNLTFKSGFQFHVELHSVRSDTLGRVHGGKFKNTPLLDQQLKTDVKNAGSWSAVQEMTISFEYRNIDYKYQILVSTPIDQFAEFKVISDNEVN